MRKVSYSHLSLLLNVRQEGTLVVDFEGEDPVLVWQFEGCAEDGTVGCCADGVEWKAVEGREHAEFKLEAVCGGDDEGRVVAIGVFGEFNVEGLCGGVSIFWGEK